MDDLSVEIEKYIEDIATNGVNTSSLDRIHTEPNLSMFAEELSPLIHFIASGEV